MPDTLDAGARRALLDACDQLAPAAEAALARLVRCPSTLGNEAACCNEIEQLWREAGLSPFRIPVEEAALAPHRAFSPPLLAYAGRDNLGAIHRPRGAGGRSLCLQGHFDVVPEGAAELWTTPPFEPAIRDGRLFGRGAGDMKAGLVSALFAFRAFREAGLAPAAELSFAAVIEEECTGNGALAAMLALPRPDAVIIPEPGPGRDAIYTAEVGVVWAFVTVTGRPAHVRDKQAGLNAIEAAQGIIARFLDYEREQNRAGRVHAAFAGLNHPLNVNLGTIEGGEWNSSVPTRCRFGLRVGVMLGRSADQVRAEIEAIVAEAAAALPTARVGVEFRGFHADPCAFDMDSDIARLARHSYAEATGGALRDYPATGLTDGRHYVLEQGTPVAVFGPDATEIHGIDESVGLASMHRITRTIALAIAGWCGVEHA